jgi:sec-independent protein translocase protein TatA
MAKAYGPSTGRLAGARPHQKARQAVLGGLHWYDLIILVVLALVVFGPKRLPEMGSAVGKTIKEFQKSMREVTQPTQDVSTTALPAASARPIEPPVATQPATMSAPAAAPESSTAPTGAVPSETRPE